MADRLAQAAPGLSEDERASAVRDFDEDLGTIIERRSAPATASSTAPPTCSTRLTEHGRRLCPIA